MNILNKESQEQRVIRRVEAQREESDNLMNEAIKRADLDRRELNIRTGEEMLIAAYKELEETTARTVMKFQELAKNLRLDDIVEKINKIQKAAISMEEFAKELPEKIEGIVVKHLKSFSNEMERSRKIELERIEEKDKEYKLFAVLILGCLVGIFLSNLYMFNSNNSKYDYMVKKNRAAINEIHTILKGNEKYWYSTENHTIYLKDVEKNKELKRK